MLEALKSLYRQDEAADEDEQGIGADDGSSEALSKVLLRGDVPMPRVPFTFLAKTTSTVLQEIFTNYKPSSINRGLPHPGSIAEATSLRCRPCHLPSNYCFKESLGAELSVEYMLAARYSSPALLILCMRASQTTLWTMAS